MRCVSKAMLWLLVSTALIGAAHSSRGAQDEAPIAEPPASESSPPDVEAADSADGLVRLHPKYGVWIDKPGKRVVLVGEVCLREGMLELFACIKMSKEHESVIAIPTEASVVHAALLAVGALAGNPTQYRPEYRKAAGSEIEVTLFWTGQDGRRHRARAQQWVRDARTKKEMAQPWVFGGSSFWVDEETGKKYYMAEDGDLICLSNFPSAMLDLPIESSQSNEALLFEAFTDRIPPVATRVTVVLTPKPGSYVPSATAAGDTPPDEKK